MTIVSFNFTLIEAEKKEVSKGKINISNNVTIEKVEEKDLSLGSQKQKVLCFTFEFTSKYEPNAGNIKLVGNVLYMENSKRVKEILDDWKKDKRFPIDSWWQQMKELISDPFLVELLEVLDEKFHLEK